MASNSIPSYLLGLDIGSVRIGTAVASSIARLPRPLKPIQNSPEVFEEIQKLVSQENIDLIVVGIPRNLDGDETAQSKQIRDFAQQLKQRVSCKVQFADESLSSVRAEDAIKNSGGKGQSSDSLAACYILEEFFNHYGEKL